MILKNTEINNLKVKELKALAKENNIPVKGSLKKEEIQILLTQKLSNKKSVKKNSKPLTLTAKNKNLKRTPSKSNIASIKKMMQKDMNHSLFSPEEFRKETISLPDYDKTYVFMMPRDPSCIFAYWSITEELVMNLKKQNPLVDFNKVTLSLRIFKKDGDNSTIVSEMFPSFGTNHYYVEIPFNGGLFFCNLSFITSENQKYLPVLESNTIEMPKKEVSASVDPHWITFDNFLQIFHGNDVEPAFSGTFADLQKLSGIADNSISSNEFHSSFSVSSNELSKMLTILLSSPAFFSFIISSPVLFSKILFSFGISFQEFSSWVLSSGALSSGTFSLSSSEIASFKVTFKEFSSWLLSSGVLSSKEMASWKLHSEKVLSEKMSSGGSFSKVFSSAEFSSANLQTLLREKVFSEVMFSGLFSGEFFKTASSFQVSSWQEFFTNILQTFSSKSFFSKSVSQLSSQSLQEALISSSQTLSSRLLFSENLFSGSFSHLFSGLNFSSFHFSSALHEISSKSLFSWENQLFSSEAASSCFFSQPSVNTFVLGKESSCANFHSSQIPVDGAYKKVNNNHTFSAHFPLSFGQPKVMVKGINGKIPKTFNSSTTSTKETE